ncbi:MAG: alginate export family protein [Proteobacteria bacterium]|nr:alginate export family protein [Pseudomonadota bacterium]
MTKRLFKALLIAGGFLALLAVSTAAAQADAISVFVGQGKLLFDARLRYEGVDQHGFHRDASALTLRERLGFETPDIAKFKLLAELEATQHLSNGFNDTVNGKTIYPQVPDPENLELNRLQLTYAGVPDVGLTLGRQVINLDDQRFIGASAFRQNEQTFDAARIDYTGLPGLVASYAYIDRVNRVFGERSAVSHFDGSTHIFNAAYTIADIGKVVGYAYLLDLHQSPKLSTATYGLQFGGSQTLSDALKVRYLAGYARQTDYANNPLDISLNYWRLEAGIDYDSWSLTGGIETLNGNGTIGFSTPLATLHAFQGYADAFLTTPARGISDRYAKLGYQTSAEIFGAARKLSAAIWYHDFQAMHGSGSLGHEVDLETSAKITDHWRLDLAYADYIGVAGFASRTKTWLALTLSY